MFDVEQIDVPQKDIDKLYKLGKLAHAKLGPLPVSSKYVTLKSGSQSALGYVDVKDTVHLIETKNLGYQNIKPRDAEQTCFMWGLANKPVTVCLGAAGTGKTTIALSYGIEKLFRDDRSLILCKPTVFIGAKSNAIAPIPGDEREKLRPYMDSYLPGIEKILGSDADNFLYQWEESGKLQFRAVELLRGQHFENCTLILDEAQNLSLHELCSVVSRVGEGSTVILLGDPAQIDTGARWHDTGLYLFSDSDAASRSDLVSLVRLEKQYRGPLAQLCTEVMEEYNPLDEEDLVVSSLELLPHLKRPYAFSFTGNPV